MPLTNAGDAHSGAFGVALSMPGGQKDCFGSAGPGAEDAMPAAWLDVSCFPVRCIAPGTG